MNKNELKKHWLNEEKAAHIHGWDFSHIKDRYTEETDLPWDYKKIVRSYLKEDDNLLDIDTGGGELLLEFNHPYGKTYATEFYIPNVELCKKELLPLGIHFKYDGDYNNLPFYDESFDIITNCHGSFDAYELYRILKPGGIFITEQVGEDNDRELVNLLLPGTKKTFHGLNVKDQKENFESCGFTILRSEEAFRPIKFYDVGALVWFARIIEWEFPNFSVEKCFNKLLKAQEILEKNGEVVGSIHRYLLVCRK